MSLSHPLVSVVIPCYNQAEFLGEAVDSVTRQTHPRVEIIVVDDGSRDAPGSVTKGYEGVRLIRQANQGPAAARNTGLRASKGEYLVFLDADDRLLPEAIEVGLRHLNARPGCAFVSGHCRYIAADGGPMPSPPQLVVNEDHYKLLLHRNFILAGSTVLHRRECLESVGGYNPAPVLKGAEDYDLYLRLARIYPVFCHGEAVAEYRQYEQGAANVSGNLSGMFQATLTALRTQRQYVKNNDAYRKVYRQGISHKQRLWGGMVIEQVKLQLRTPGERATAAQNIWVLLKYNKRGLLARAAARVPWLRGE
jgi:glycosyltransferase involved in cell wall biosynthesis